MKAEQDLVEFIFAAMVDTVIYKWFQIHCEGCQEQYPSQRDHACLNYGSMDSLIGLYFREFHLLVCTDWVVGACQTYLKHTQYHVIVSMVEDLRKQWVNSPQLAADAIENSTLKKLFVMILRQMWYRSGWETLNFLIILNFRTVYSWK